MGTLKALWILILAWILLFMQEGAAAQQFQSSSMYCNKKAPLTTGNSANNANFYLYFLKFYLKVVDRTYLKVASSVFVETPT